MKGREIVAYHIQYFISSAEENMLKRLAALVLCLALLPPAEIAATSAADEGQETVYVDRYALQEISEVAPKLACHG